MKAFILGLIAVCGLIATAHASMIYGPYANFEVGNTKCFVQADSKVDAATLEGWIRDAASQTFGRAALHIRATDPAVRITAGVFPSLPTFVVFEDAASMMQRSGAAAQNLIEYVRSKCPPRN